MAGGLPRFSSVAGEDGAEAAPRRGSGGHRSSYRGRPVASHAQLNNLSKPRRDFSFCFRMYVTDRVPRSPSGIPIEGKSQKTSRGLRFNNVEQLEPSMATFEKFPTLLMFRVWMLAQRSSGHEIESICQASGLTCCIENVFEQKQSSISLRPRSELRTAH